MRTIHYGDKSAINEYFEIGALSSYFIIGDNKLLRHDKNYHYLTSGRIVLHYEYLQIFVHLNLYDEDGMLFRIKSYDSGVIAICGYCNFYHNDDRNLIYLPYWIYDCLGTCTGKKVLIYSIYNVGLCRFVRLKPESTKMYEVLKDDDPNKRMILTEAIAKICGIIYGYWVYLDINKELLWFKVTKCDPEFCRTITVGAFDIKIDFESADELDYWELNNQLTMEFNRLYHELDIIDEKGKQVTKPQQKMSNDMGRIL